MYRSEEDLIIGFNCLALATVLTESRLLGEGFMTTHNHSLVQTDNPDEVMYRSRFAYARFFNAKYGRKGMLGERKCFSLEVEGLHHITAALNYILRQGLHHGLSSTPFGYPHCSANSFFRKELGKIEHPELIRVSGRHRYLPRNRSLPPDKYRMSSSGLLLREDVIDTAYVEEIYISPRNFLFQMNVPSGRDIREQQEENKTPPVTVDKIEAGVPEFNVKDAMIFEQGRVDRNRMTDLELCSIVDNQIVPRYCKGGQRVSVYSLSDSQRSGICEMLWKESCQSRFGWAPGRYLSGKYVSELQLRRCLCIC